MVIVFVHRVSLRLVYEGFIQNRDHDPEVEHQLTVITHLVLLQFIDVDQDQDRS